MDKVRREGSPLKISLIHVSRAHFQAKAETSMYIELPEERREPGRYGKLLYNLYGTRFASQGWAQAYVDKMDSWNYESGASCPAISRIIDSFTIVRVHGNDFIALGTDEELD